MAPPDPSPLDPLPDIELDPDPDPDPNEKIDLALDPSLAFDPTPAPADQSPPDTNQPLPSGRAPATRPASAPLPGAVNIDKSLQKLQRAVKIGSLILLILITLTLIIIYNLFAYRSSHENNLSTSQQTPPNNEDANLQSILADPSMHLPRMREVTENFLAAESVAEILPFCRDSDRVAPLLDEYYRRNPFEPTGILQFGLGDSLVLETDAGSDRSFVYVSFETTDYHSRTVCLEIINENFKVDWESAVGYSEMSWENFQEHRPTQPTLFRVVAMPSDYHNYEFRDPSVWASLKLFDRTGNSELYGFVRRDTPQHRRVLHALQGNPNAWLVTKLKYPENARSATCVEIDDVIHDRWVLGLSVERMPSIDLPPEPATP
jgi:hypothetical protein